MNFKRSLETSGVTRPKFFDWVLLVFVCGFPSMLYARVTVEDTICVPEHNLSMSASEAEKLKKMAILTRSIGSPVAIFVSIYMPTRSAIGKEIETRIVGLVDDYFDEQKSAKIKKYTSTTSSDEMALECGDSTLPVQLTILFPEREMK